MSAYTSIALNDSALTPESPGTPATATRTFLPGGKDSNGVWTWYENTTGSTAATRSKMTLSLTPGKDVTRCKIQISTPKAQTVDGIVSAAHVTRSSMEFILPNNGSRDDRRDIRNLTFNALAAAAAVAAIDDLEAVYS